MTSYEQAIRETGDTLARYTKPIWAVVKHTPFANDFLGTMFRWGAFCSDVPCAVVPCSASIDQVLRHIKRIMSQKHQEFPLLKRYLWWVSRNRCPRGLSGFQANVSTNLAMGELLGDGFVVFTDQGRLYPQYAKDYGEKLGKHWDAWPIKNIDNLSMPAIHTIAALQRAEKGYSEGWHLTDDYYKRLGRADRRRRYARLGWEHDLKPVRKWLADKFPRYESDTWNGSSHFCGTEEFLNNLVYPYINKKPSAIEEKASFKQWDKVNDEHLTLWRQWWASNVVPMVNGRG